MKQETSGKTGVKAWTKPQLVRLGLIRDIAQQGPPFTQGNGQFS